MMDIPLKDTKATGGGCGCGSCGCGSDAETPATQATQAIPAPCNCGPDCTCGCQDGQPCTCDSAADAGSAHTSQDAADVPAGAAVYRVSGMTCGHCVKAVTEEVSAIPGVTDVQVDLDSRRLVITSEAPVDFDRLVEAVAEAGDYTID